jgi:hypothetical protein
MVTAHPLSQVHLIAPQVLLWIALAHHGDIILAPSLSMLFRAIWATDRLEGVPFYRADAEAPMDSAHTSVAPRWKDHLLPLTEV